MPRPAGTAATSARIGATYGAQPPERRKLMLPEDVRAIALMLPEAVAGAHKGNPDFRVGGRVFATLWAEEDRLVLRLSPVDRDRLVEAEPDLFSPIPGTWGRRGWTNLDLDSCDEEILREALLAAWCATAPGGLVAAYGPP